MLSAARRALPLWLALVAVYALTLAVPGGPGGHGRLSAPEAHRLLVADSLVHDGDVDLRNQYADRAWRDFYDGDLRPAAEPTDGRLVEPVGLGFTLLIAPAYRVGGADGVRVWLALITALGFCLAAALARVLVPEPWATRAALVAGRAPAGPGGAAPRGPPRGGGRR